MPITSFLDSTDFDLEAKRVMGLAFEMAHAALQPNWDNYADGYIAKRIIKLAKSGERDPNILCEEALKGLHGSL